MIADINASDQFEKTKRLIVISNSTIFIEDKAKFEHWLSIMQNKLEANVDWYSIERMTMTYLNTRFDEETYKHISTRLNKNFCRFTSLRYGYDLIQLVKSMLLNWVGEKGTIL
jgi:hypothetical protein